MSEEKKITISPRIIEAESEKQFQRMLIKRGSIGSIIVLGLFIMTDEFWGWDVAYHLFSAVFFGLFLLAPLVSFSFLMDEARDSIIAGIKIKVYGLFTHPDDMDGPFTYKDKMVSVHEVLKEIRQTHPNFLFTILASHFVFGMGIYYGMPHWRFLSRLWE